MKAADKLKGHAEKARQRGYTNLAKLFEENAAKGEDHAKQYLDMMAMVGTAAKRIREKEGW